MAGMMTGGLSGSDTMVAFKVTGLRCQDVSKTSNGTISGISMDSSPKAAPAKASKQEAAED